MTPRAATLAEVVDVVHRRFDPSTAESWDAVGLVVGDPSAEVRRVLLAVDATAVVVDEAIAWDADLLLTHHPLLLRPVSSVAATSPQGRTVHRLISGGCGLLAAHTNADAARDGVSDVLASVLGIVDLEPLVPSAYDARTGLGRVGRAPAGETLRTFAARVAETLPTTVHGVRVAGDLDRAVSRIAVCGGSGADALDAATAAGADVFLTADLKHHNAGEHLEAGGPALVDVAHWASEWPWLERAAHLLVSDLLAIGVTVESRVSAIVTDPWTARF